VFAGAFDPKDPPRTLPERVIRMLPMSKGILPVGDFRDWPAIEAWARTIAAELLGPVPVG
jgi:menaquinone-dependent protoporphyrinogen oxidase